MNLWNYNDIAQLAPDVATMQRARGISYALNRWQELAGNEKIVWGIYQGGGHQRYRVMADLEHVRFSCTCRSPLHPCKHALALPLLLLRSNEHFRVAYELPDWVKRRPPKESPITKAPSKVAGAPSDKRMLSMQAGIDELEQRLMDIAERGLAAAAPPEADFWEQWATRMVDAKLPGVAARLRQLLPYLGTDDWYAQLLMVLADLYLLVRGFQRYEHLPPALQREVLTAAGVTVKRDQVLAEAGHTDRWLVVGVREGEEERLSFRRTWLLGEQSGRMALLLDFNWDQRGYPQSWPPGMVFDGRLHYYPGSEGLRAVVGDFTIVQEPFAGLTGIFTFSEWPEYLARQLALNPWTYTLPCLLAAVRPVMQEERCLLIDAQHMAYELAGIPDTTAWTMMAVSGGHPISVFGEWLNGSFSPLSMVEADRVISL